MRRKVNNEMSGPTETRWDRETGPTTSTRDR